MRLVFSKRDSSNENIIKDLLFLTITLSGFKKPSLEDYSWYSSLEMGHVDWTAGTTNNLCHMVSSQSNVLYLVPHTACAQPYNRNITNISVSVVVP